MYKTVRKGDTSLQYTILPQTDQLASGGCPQQNPGGGKGPSSRPRNIKYTMGTVMILIVVSILGAPIMVNQVKYDHMVHKMMTMRQVELIVNDTYNTRSQTKADAGGMSKNRSRLATTAATATATTTTTMTTTTMSTTVEVTRTKDFEDSITSTLNGVLREEEEEEEDAVVVDDATLTGTIL